MDTVYAYDPSTRMIDFSFIVAHFSNNMRLFSTLSYIVSRESSWTYSLLIAGLWTSLPVESSIY